MNPKSFTFAAVASIFLIPLGFGIFNHFIGSRFLPLPHGLLGEDFPLESRMYVAKNFTGDTYFPNIYTGLNKTTYSTTKMGFRVPEVDFSKDLVLMSGDSILFGLGLNDWETVPYLLQNKEDFKYKYSFFNAGLPGKSMAHHLLTLKNLIQLSQKRGARIKYLMMWTSFNDLEENISLKTIQSRALKKDLPLKDRLAFRFTSLATFYKTIRDRTIGTPLRVILSSLFAKNKSYRYELIPLAEPDQTHRFFSSSKVIDKNLEHLRDIIELCNKYEIILIHVITAYGYKDIFYENGFSEYMEESLKGLKQEHIIKLKDIYHSHPEIYPHISKRGYDWGHFSYKAAQLIAEQISNYINKLETP
jgi:hypothetical protein